MLDPLHRCLVVCCLLFSCSLSNGVYGQFADYSNASDITINTPIAMWGCGMSAFDFNDDGYDDLTIAENLSGIALYQSMGDGTFVLVDYITLNANIKQVMWIDFDNDHDPDLFATTNGNGFLLYEQTDDGSLIHRTDLFDEYSGFDGQGASWVDYDKDGWKDLFVCHYLYGQAPEHPNLLFHNQQGVFVEVGEQVGVASWANQAFQGVWTDFDRDGWPDLYVINDHEVGNEFYRNNAGMGFENLSAVNGSAMSLASMSNSVADFDRDGDFDVFVSNGGYQALLQCADGMFENVATQMGINVFTFGWSGLWIDHDNDGWQDLYLCNTNGYGNGDNNFFWLNQLGTAFSEVPFDPYAMSSFVAVTGDFNNDRLPDMAVYNGYPSEVHVWLNETHNANHAVKMNLQGEVSDFYGVGAEVSAYIDGAISLQQVLAGENYLGQNTSSILIGCGDATLIDSLVVVWPSGWKDVFLNVPVDSNYTITEGETFDVSVESVDDFLMCPGASCHVHVVISDTTFQGSIVWSSGNAGFNAQLVDTGSYTVTVTNSFGLQRTLSFTTTYHALPQIQKTISPPLCNGQGNGQCVLTSEDVVSIDGLEFQSPAILGNLNAGGHSFVVVDVHGCVSEVEVLVPETPAMSITQSSITVCANTTEFPPIEIQNATPPLSVEWLSEADEGEQIETGEHEMEVNDSNGCEATFSVFLDHFPSAQVIVFADTVCAGNETLYTWLEMGDVEVVWAQVVNEIQNELTAGNYTLQAEDEFGCTSYHDFTIYEFPPLEMFVVFNELSNQLEAEVTGGVDPYAYQWNTGDTTTSIQISDGGDYVLSITDAVGCTLQGDTTLVLSNVDEPTLTWQIITTPAYQRITIESPASGQLFIYDQQGRIVHTERIRAGRLSWDRADLPAGRYVARLVTDD